MPRPTAHLLTCIRNEGPFLVEFVAHHLVLGFDRIFIAANDCDDGSVRLLRAMQAAGHVGFVQHRVAAGKVPQAEGYARLRERFDVDAAEWLMMLDADEFLNVHAGDHTLEALLAEPLLDPSAVRQVLGELATKVTMHLAMEDRALYPLLAGSRNPATSQLATQFQQSMGGLFDTFVAFDRKYAVVKSISTGQAEFVAEARAVLAALSARIAHEEQELYPLLDAE